MTDAEQSQLTEAMLHSGEILDFSNIPKPKVDKHSTGGVGDKTSLLIAPFAAAAGVCVPMISGRGLGHTGGTLDKLEAIPGYRVNLSLKEFRAVLDTTGFAMNGQTAEIAPADKKLYALRDATATIEAIPLIVGSIISKKGAAGLDAMVIDVKTGSGAFMSDPAKAKQLAQALVKTGNSHRHAFASADYRHESAAGQRSRTSIEVLSALTCYVVRSMKARDRCSSFQSNWPRAWLCWRNWKKQLRRRAIESNESTNPERRSKHFAPTSRPRAASPTSVTIPPGFCR